MGGIYTLAFAKEKKGSTTYTVIDVPKCGFEVMPDGFFMSGGKRTAAGDLAGEITTGMTAYRAEQQYASGTASEPASDTGSAPAADDADSTEW